MPRNASGAYTLPNPDVITDTTIESSDENATRNDIETELTSSLDRSGRGTMLAALKITDGTVANPGIAFASDLDNGFFRNTTNDWSAAAGGTDVLRFTSSGISFPVGVTYGVQTIAQFTADQNDLAVTAPMVRTSADTTLRSVTGISGGAAGKVITLHNVGTSPYILKDENAGSSAANRFALTRDYVVNPDGVVALQYDATSLRWRVVGPEGIPAGVMLDFGGASAPAGYLLCDGSVITRASQPALFVAIGTTWNTGGEAGTDFRLPNFQRRAAVGSGGAGTATLGNAVGNVGGSETVTLALSETPAHSHGGTTGGQSADHTHSGTTGTVSADHTHSFTTSSDGAHTHDVTVQLSAGGVTGVQGTETGSGAANIANAAVSAGTHQHTGTTGGISANHTHAFTSGGVSVGHTHTIESEGGGGAHNNLGPRAIVTKIIKT